MAGWLGQADKGGYRREKFRTLYINARSLNNEIEELEVKVDNEESDIIVVSETRF